MPKKLHDTTHGFCSASDKIIICLKCLRPAKLPPSLKKKQLTCDYHKALFEFRDKEEVGDDNPFDVTRFIDRIEWVKVTTTCEPEMTSLFKNIRRANQELMRRVV